MNINNEAQKLLDAFDNWIKESSRPSYKFSVEEQHELEQMIAIMNNHIDALVEFELKRKEQ